MRKSLLGKTGLEVTELCFGALPMGPLQAKMAPADAVELLSAAIDAGINFFDTAELYGTQTYLGQAIRARRDKVVIATKSVAATYEEMEKSVHRSLAELGVETIDVYHLHAARVTAAVFAERAGALQCLCDYRRKGIIRAVGISTHAIEVVRAAAGREEIDVVFPLINRTGLGIIDGTAAAMVEAIGLVVAAGKGVYAMKALAGGHLIDNPGEAFAFVRAIPGVQSLAVGMLNHHELAMNLRLFRGEAVPPELLALTGKKQKHLLVSHFCVGCGSCVAACPNQALTLQSGKAVVDPTKCLLCGYCSPHCPQFAIRLV